MTWVFGPGFEKSAPILAIHAWSFIPYSIGVARTQYLTVENRLAVNIQAVGLALLINLGLNAWLIPIYGGLGAAWATLASYTAAWVLSSLILPGTADISQLLLSALQDTPRALGRGVQKIRQAAS